MERAALCGSRQPGRGRLRALGLVLLLAIGMLPGCASAPPPADVAAPRAIEPVRRLAIVGVGESKFTVLQWSEQPGRTIDEVLRWNAYGQMLRPLTALVHQGLNRFFDLNHSASAGRHVAGITPRSVVAETFGQVLESTGRFEQISTLDREPVGADRDRADAVLRVAVPEWGLVRVREGDPSLVSSFAEVRVQMVRPGTGIVIWEAGEDVTNPDRLPMTSFTQDSEFARQELRDVLARAGHRLASEFLYAQEGSR